VALAISTEGAENLEPPLPESGGSVILQLTRAKGATKDSFVFYNYFKILPPSIRPACWKDPCEFIPSAPSKNTLAALHASCFLHFF